MLFLEINTFRQLVVSLIGELSPNMYWLYDIMSVVCCFLFIMLIYAFLNVVFKIFKRW